MYKSKWTPYVGELLTAEKENNNIFDVNAICICDKDTKIVGHAPRELASVLKHFINHSGVNLEK